MRWHEIMEEASAGATASGNIAAVSFQRHPAQQKTTTSSSGSHGIYS